MTEPQKKPVRRPRGPSVNVVVTNEIMQTAKRRDSSHCMIQQAVRDAWPAATSIAVDVQTIRFSLPEKRIRCTYLTPRIAQLALVRWDQGKMPEPFTFWLRQAHVTAMYDRTKHTTPSSRHKTAKAAAALAKARSVAPSHQTAALAKAGLRDRGGSAGSVLERVGGRPPPTTPFARRRSFGLRALEL